MHPGIGTEGTLPGLVVHEWLARTGGSENVVQAIMEALPESDLWALWNDAPERFPSARESWLSRVPLRKSRVAALPLMPSVWRHIPATRKYDWVLASSHLFAHHARVESQPRAPKLSYVHTPARYIWAPEIDARGQSLPVRAIAPAIRKLDKARASELQSAAANSEYVRQRIRDSWGIDARVIYPPVDVARITSVEDWRTRLSETEAAAIAKLPSQFLLGASRFVEYKRLDDAIRVGQSMGLPVVLAGSGPDGGRLRSIAEKSSVPVTFIERPSDEMLYSLYQLAFAFVFLPIEDFGIMPVEAMACGTPVIVSPKGGARESVTLCGGGATLSDPSNPELVQAVAGVIEGLDRASISGRTAAFSRERFAGEVRDWILQEAGEL